MSSVSSSRGAFILLEGTDRSGKSTQAKTLVQNLKDRDVTAEGMHFPDRSTPTGDVLDKYLKGTVDASPDVIHLLFAANRLEKKNEIVKKLMGGTTIVMDRYAPSGAAFTVAKGCDGLSLEWCQSIERGKLPAPDLVFFMDLPVTAAARRSGFGTEKYETLKIQQSVREAFDEMMDQEQWTVIDAQRPPSDISEELLRLTLDMVHQCKAGRTLRSLWQTPPNGT